MQEENLNSELNEVYSLNKEKEKANSELLLLQNLNSKLEEKNKELLSQNFDLLKTENSLKEKIDFLETELSDFKKENKKFSEKLKMRERDYNSLIDIKSELQSENKILNKQISDTKKESIKNQTSELIELSEKLVKLDSLNITYKNKIDELEKILHQILTKNPNINTPPLSSHSEKIRSKQLQQQSQAQPNFFNATKINNDSKKFNREFLVSN